MPSAISFSNRLLGALSPEDLDPLGEHLEPVPLPHKQTLAAPRTPIDRVYFVEEGMVSLVQPLEKES
jgi:CRP-like cAMP-binding protein